MDKVDILKALEDDSKYYGEFGQQFISNSDIGKLLKNPTQFRKPQEMTKPMLEGRYFHTKILEPHKLDEFKIIDASSRNTKIYSEAINEGEILLLKKEQEVPEVEKIMTLDWKGKADIIHKHYIIDIKTTGDIDKFMYSAKTYNYDSQAYIYQRLFGKPLIFLVIDKRTARLGIFKCSDSFLRGGMEKVADAVAVYHKYFSDEATEDIHSYIHRQEL